VRRSAAIAIAGIASMLLQTAVFPVLIPASLAPNLLLVLVVYLGVQQFGAAGALGAFVLGYFLDTFSGTLLWPACVRVHGGVPGRPSRRARAVDRGTGCAGSCSPPPSRIRFWC
jgi:hypothetical protein